MKPVVRRTAYLTSALAVVCFFALPDPNLAIISALLLQTLAFTVVAGKSSADGIVLTGISILLIGFLPSDHPLIRGDFFESIRLWIIVTGIVVGVAGIVLIAGRLRSRSHR